MYYFQRLRFATLSQHPLVDCFDQLGSNLHYGLYPSFLEVYCRKMIEHGAIDSACLSYRFSQLSMMSRSDPWDSLYYLHLLTYLDFSKHHTYFTATTGMHCSRSHYFLPMLLESETIYFVFKVDDSLLCLVCSVGVTFRLSSEPTSTYKVSYATTNVSKHNLQMG